MPAVKKDPSTRKRRNRAASAETFVVEPELVGGDGPAVPDLPSLGRRQWHAAVEAWWVEVWTSPFSSAYLGIDRAALEMLAVLLNDFWRAGNARERAQAAAEIRLHRRDVGMTPYDRKRLEWQVRAAPAPDAPDDAAPEAGRWSAPEGPEPDPRVALHAV